MPTRARERLLEAAEELFYSEGIRAVGVERLIAVSGVGRASFYRHFGSKDELVVTMLREYDHRWREWLERQITARGRDPLAVFDALGERFAAPDFRGCASINAMVEMADPGSAAHQVAVEHKKAVLDYLGRLLTDAGFAASEPLAEQFLLLMDGATVTALREPTAAPAARAKHIARMLLS